VRRKERRSRKINRRKGLETVKAPEFPAYTQYKLKNEDTWHKNKRGYRMVGHVGWPIDRRRRTLRINCPTCNRRTDLVDGTIVEHIALGEKGICVASGHARRSDWYHRRKKIAETRIISDRIHFEIQGTWEYCQRFNIDRRSDEEI